MQNTVPFPSSSQSASQQYTFESPAGFQYVLYKLPAMRCLALANQLVTYFGEPTIKAVFAMVKHAQVENLAAVEAQSDADVIDAIVAALEQAGGFSKIPLDAFQSLARCVCPFVQVAGKPPVSPDETNVKLADAKIDLMFEQNPSDVLRVVLQAIAFNLKDFFSDARLLSRREASKGSS
jgi:hypothetical protein